MRRLWSCLVVLSLALLGAAVPARAAETVNV